MQLEDFDLSAAREYRIEYKCDHTWKEFCPKYTIWTHIAYRMVTMALGQISGVGASMFYRILVFEGLRFSAGNMSLLPNVVAGVLGLA